MCRNFVKFSWLFLLLQAAAVHPAFADEASDRDALRIELEQLAHSGLLGNSKIASVSLLLEIYERRNFLPAWNRDKQVGELVTAIEATLADGLDPADYHLEKVKIIHADRLAASSISSRQRAVRDLVLTDSLVRLGYHQLFGKVNPYTLDSNWNFRRELNDIDPATAIQSAIDSPSLTAYLADFFQRGWFYQTLRNALVDYRRIAADGGWAMIPDGPTIRPGDSDARLAALAQRLVVSGDLAARDASDQPGNYDAALQQAVRGFQQRHGLDDDAIIGPATLLAMNVPVEKRIEQLEVNIERARWVMDDIKDDLVLVNIAGFRTYVIRNREITWETKVQVGTTYRQSPVFRDEIKYVVLNPTWTVPFSIATRDILPKIRSNPDFFSTRDFDLKDGRGNFVDPAGVNWAPITDKNFPFWLVQRPGPNNALGRIKIMFPNEHAVYLHDTPSKALFGRSERAFSSGCIRVEKPFDFAEQLLGADGWNQQKFQQALEQGDTKTIYLSKPVPVLLLYWTAMATPDGVVHFYNDVYSRDANVSKALAEPFRLDPPS